MPSAPIILLAFVGGLLAIVSPCILPVVPLIFSQVERPGRERALVLAGLALSFALAAAAASAGVSWIGPASTVGRWLALALMALVAVSLISARAAEWMTRPLARLGSTLDQAARESRSPAAPFVAGFAVGLLWAPCAGPILALVIAGGTVPGEWGRTLVLLLAFAAGAGVALGAVLSAGNRMLSLLRRSSSMNRFIRPALGVAVLAAVVAIAFGADRALLARGNFVQTASAEELLVNHLAHPAPRTLDIGGSLGDFAAEEAAALPDDGAMPDFVRGREWINSPPLTRASLRGKVVLVDFWAFMCVNCLNALPHVKELYAKYKDQGFVVVGVHTPELAPEKVPAGVRQAVKDLGITFPVVIDGDYAIWNRWQNEYWPAAYFVDAKGRIRYHHFGEGSYDEQDRVVQKLLAEAKASAGGR